MKEGSIRSTNQLVGIFQNGISLYVKREDLLHPVISGNKFRKLKYNLLEAKRHGKTGLLTFGGAYSNHIAAVAAAGNGSGLKTIGFIRGEELGKNVKETTQQNLTLNFSQEKGMDLKFISREKYREKSNVGFLKELQQEFPDYYILPEGGTNALAIKGCEEILSEEDGDFNFVCCAVGTGGTFAGLANSAKQSQKVLGFPALKGTFLNQVISDLTSVRNWELSQDYHFGGYAKVTSELIYFINDFKSRYKIALDPVYTGKMFFGIFDLMEKGYFPQNSRILAIHTGGIQGIAGMNSALIKRNLPQINV